MNNDLWDSNDTRIGGEEPPIEMEYNLGFTSPSIAVIETISSIEGVCPVELSTSGRLTLSDHVDPDALDRLLTDRNGDCITITFSVDEYTVWVRRGKIAVARTVSSSTDLE